MENKNRKTRGILMMLFLIMIASLTGAYAQASLAREYQASAVCQDWVAEGQFANQSGTNGIVGASWRLCENGLLEVNEGFINWTGNLSPWHDYRHDIQNIIFTGPITAGTSLSRLFQDLENVTVIEGLELFDTSRVTTLRHLFWNARSLTSVELSGWDTSNLRDIVNLFHGTSLTHLDLSNWDTSRVTNMQNTFREMNSLISLDVSTWNTSHVTRMDHTFRNTNSLTNLDLSTWNTHRVVDMDSMLRGMTSLRILRLGENFVFGEGPSTRLPEIVRTHEFTGSWQNVGQGTLVHPLGNHVLTSSELIAQFDGQRMADTYVWQQTANQSSCQVMVQGQLPHQSGSNGMAGSLWRLCDNGVLEVEDGFINWAVSLSPWYDYRHDIHHIIFTGPIIAGTSLRGLFQGLDTVTTIEGLAFFDTSNVTNIRQMFRNASSLTSLDVSTWDTSNVRDMVGLFHETTSLTSLDLSAWDTSRVTTLQNTFRSMSSLTSLDVSTWDTSRVTQMDHTFRNTNHLTRLDVSSWDTNRVTNMDNMLRGMYSLRYLTLGENFTFGEGARLPSIVRTREWTGSWQNVGHGTLESPQGDVILRSATLMRDYDGQTMADTYVWQGWEDPGAPVIERRDRSEETNPLGVWWWSTPLEMRYLEFAANNGVTEIWLSHQDFGEPTRAFIAAATEKDIEVHFLAGDFRWIHPELRHERQYFHDLMANFLDYQETAAPNERFTGIHLNVEPHQHPDWETQNQEVRNRHLQLYIDFVVEVTDLYGPVDWSVPFWWGRPSSSNPLIDDTVNYRGNEVLIHQAIIHEADRVKVMSYRDSGAGMYSVASHYIDYAASIDRPIFLSAELGAHQTNVVSFWRHGRTHMHNELDLLRQFVRDEREFGRLGIAIHHIGHWYRMAD